MLNQSVRFAAIGILCTLAYLVLFLALRPIGAQGANLAALLLTAVANTAANRRFTFGIRGRANAGRHQFEGLIVFAIGLVLTSTALAVLNSFGEHSRIVELLVLLLANLGATVVRFMLLRGWVFHPRRAGATAEGNK